MSKNERAKTRPLSSPYETYSASGWTWKVLKHYASAEREAVDRYARVFCAVTSPYVDDELGDVYCRDIPGYEALPQPVSHGDVTPAEIQFSPR